MMVRYLAILVLIGAGLSRIGVGLPGGHASCEDAGCHVPVVEVSCCGDEGSASASENAGADEEYCPMSDGPCRCGVERGPAPERLPDAPQPRIDRDLVFGLAPGTRVLHRVPVLGREAGPAGLRLGGCRAGLTHNEVRALLGVWRT